MVLAGTGDIEKPKTRNQECGDAPAIHSVLYVDDEHALLDVCKNYFDRRGDIAITGADSAISAIELLKTRSFEVIISDYQMPGMTGIDLLKHLQQQKSSTPFILFTGQGREEIVIEAINNGATYYLQKGGTPKVLFTELEHKIREAIRRQCAEKALLESDARYRAVFENSGTAILIIEEDMTIRRCNQEFLRLTGSARPDVEGIKSLKEFVHHEDVQKICERHQFRRQHRDQGAQQYEARVLTRTGTIRSVRITADGIPGTMKSVVSLVDITEPKRLEEELKKREDEIRILYAYLASVNKTVSSLASPVSRQGDNGMLEQQYARTAYITGPEKTRSIRMWDMDFPSHDS